MNLFELFIKIGVDDQASDKISNLSSKLGNGLKTAAKVGAAAVAAAGTAIVAIGKQSIEQYAEYEQLVGGVETLFKTSSGRVMEYAENAYKTAGLSANAYMETVTSFSASLLQSLGGDTAAAVEYADMAITDMSDNANKMGTSMEMIQNAYQGFAKQNYTMLDNLKLGYGGTQAEMKRLIADAAGLSDTVDAQSMSFDNIVEAIHVVQTEMGITGTTAKEASTTIQGSLASMKSAWENLLIGVADDNANFEVLVSNFVDSVVTAGSNIIPRVEIIIDGLSKIISEAANKLVPLVVNTIVENLPQIIGGGVNLIVSLISGLISAIPQLVQSIPQIIIAIINGFVSAWPQLKQAGIDLLQMVGNGIESMFSTVVGWGKSIVSAIGDGIKSLASKAMTWARDLINNFISGVKSLISEIMDVGKSVVNAVGDGIKSLASEALTWGKDMIDNFVSGIKSKISAVTSAVSGIASTVKSFLGFSEPEKGPLSNFHTYAPDMMDLFIKGIRDNEKKLTDQIEKTFDFGERTITAGISYRSYGDGGFSNGSGYGASQVSVVQNIYSEAKTAADLMQEALYQQERAVLLGV